MGFEVSRRHLLVAGCVLIAGCDGEGTLNPGPTPPPPGPPPPQAVTLDFSFSAGLAGWEAAYADYTLGQEEAIDFRFGHERLPPPLSDQSGFFLSSQNASDDVFMFISRLLDGLAPATRYRVDIEIVFATDAPPDCAGIGGAPGEAVAVKAGASPVRPEKVVREENYVTVNFDKGNQTNNGRDLILIGNFAQRGPGGSCDLGSYQRKTLSTGGGGPVVTSDSQGRLWLVIGTDSGFEGLTKIYYLQGTATLTPV